MLSSAGGSHHHELRPSRSTITDRELSECDREDLRHIGSIQGDCGHVIFIKYPSGEILAHDLNIHDIPWVRARDGKIRYEDTASEDSADAVGSEFAADLPSLTGDSLQNWIPFSLHRIIYDCVEQMKSAMSQRTFTFYTHRSLTSALSISSTMPDCPVVGIEIEMDSNAHEVSGALQRL